MITFTSLFWKLVPRVLEAAALTAIPIIHTSLTGYITMSNLPKKSVVASATKKDKEDIAGYGNIKIKTRNKQGVEKLSSIGIYGLMLRDTNKVEKALLDLMRNGDIDTLHNLELVMDITLLDDTEEDDDIEFVTK